MKPYIKVVAFLLIPLQLTACSTMFGRQHNLQDVSFDSNVSEVEVTCSGKSIKTPGSILLTQSRDNSCTAEKDGFEKTAFKINSKSTWRGFVHSTAVNTALWGWWTWGIGTAIGWLIDYASGSMKDLTVDRMEIDLKQKYLQV